jgi:hypothetical protein
MMDEFKFILISPRSGLPPRQARGSASTTVTSFLTLRDPAIVFQKDLGLKKNTLCFSSNPNLPHVSANQGP